MNPYIQYTLLQSLLLYYLSRTCRLPTIAVHNVAVHAVTVTRTCRTSSVFAPDTSLGTSVHRKTSQEVTVKPTQVAGHGKPGHAQLATRSAQGAIVDHLVRGRGVEMLGDTGSDTPSAHRGGPKTCDPRGERENQQNFGRHRCSSSVAVGDDGPLVAWMPRPRAARRPCQKKDEFTSHRVGRTMA